MKKKFIVFIIVSAFMLGIASTAKASLILTTVDFYKTPPNPLEDDHPIRDLTFDDSHYNWDTYVGVFTQTITQAGNNEVAAGFSYVDEIVVSWPDTVSTGGTIGEGQSWEVGNTNFSNIWHDVNHLSLWNYFDMESWGVAGQGLTMAMGWEFYLQEGEEANIFYSLQNEAPNDDRFFIMQFNGWDGDSIYLSSSLTINPIPEPSTMLLLGIGLFGLAGAGIRRRFKKVKE